MDGGEAAAGLESLRRLKSTDAPLFLSPSDDLAKAARIASQYLFSALKPFTSNSPLPHLVTDGFDAEQIWPQVEVQSEPLIKNLKNQLRKLEKNPEEIEKQFNLFSFAKKDVKSSLERENGFVEKESKGEESEEEEEESDDDEEGDDEEEEMNVDEDGEDVDEEDEDEDEEEEEKGKKNGVEDKFLKIKELEEYLEFDEEREYGSKDEKKKKNKRKRWGDGEDTDEEEEDDDDDDDDDLELLGMDGEEDDEEADRNARYEDFFAVQKKTSQKKRHKPIYVSDDSDMDDGPVNEKNDQKKHNLSTHEKEQEKLLNQKKHNLSTHEKEQEKLRTQIELMEKSNLDPKDWTMRGEITAGRREKNSALEVDLDFEHNVRPAPVITEEVTASLEEVIQKRILEGRFDDVQRSSTLPSRARKEVKEMDENKSKKGLAEVYEEEYVQKTGLVSAALSFSDEQKKEASMLFKKLCLKLDALSHFHFTPKPVIEDMSIQANVPALAMEEIAPVAVSDAAMLAPEEVFAGKGDIKEETELSQAERKRRRANKKRKFKAESAKKLAKKAQQSMPSKQPEGKEDS